MQQQTRRKPQPLRKLLGWLPAMWYVDIMGIIAGLLLGATAGLYLAKPFFDRGQTVPGVAYTAFSIGIALVPFPLEYALYRIFVSPVSHSRASRNPELEAAFQYQQI